MGRLLAFFTLFHLSATLLGLEFPFTSSGIFKNALMKPVIIFSKKIFLELLVNEKIKGLQNLSTPTRNY